MASGGGEGATCSQASSRRGQWGREWAQVTFEAGDEGQSKPGARQTTRE